MLHLSKIQPPSTMINNDSDKIILEKMQNRMILCTFLLALPFFIVALRLWQVQVLQSASHLKSSTRQSIRPVRISPVRGRILASDQSVLVDNEARYDAIFHPVEMRQPGKQSKTMQFILDSAKRLEDCVGRPSLITQETLAKHMTQRPAMPMIVFKNLSEVERSRIWELTPWIPGLDIQPNLVRHYPIPDFMPHVLGFTGTIQPNTDVMGENYSRSYVSPEQIGRSGLERVYDQELAGKPGAKLIQVDPMGYDHKELPGSLPVQHGRDLILTIDANAQAIAETVLEDHLGALVLVNCKTGAVLAMASKPGFSLDDLSAKKYKELNSDTQNKPLLNRAINALYTPGSIVKPLVALAALESGAITADTKHDCTGVYMVGKHRIHCAKRYGHGIVDVYDAITVSCNPFFMATGIKTTIDALTPFFRAAGFGRKTGIDAEEFARGLCPSREAAKARQNRNWLTVDTAYASMGQGLVQVTPLQMAVYCAALANGGTIYRPFLVQEIRTSEGKLVRRTIPQVVSTIPASSENFALVKAAMSNAVEAPEGSGHLLKSLQIRNAQTGKYQRVHLASKTGTAEIGQGASKTKDTWMICYGPLPDPQFAFACIIEHGESGSKTVAPIALEFFRQWLTSLETQPAQDN